MEREIAICYINIRQIRRSTAD